ncbi:hypothetical protein Tco_0670592 [Tanacetum coccineum]
MGDGNVSLLPRHLDVPAPTAMHGQQRIQLSPATNVNITTTFSGMSYQTVDWGCYLLFQVNITVGRGGKWELLDVGVVGLDEDDEFCRL